MKKETMYDVQKGQNNFFVDKNKERKRIIKRKKADIKSNNNVLYLTSLMGLLSSLIGVGAMKLTGEPLHLLTTIFGTPCCIIALLQAKKSYTKEELQSLKELKTELIEINKKIKDQNISKEEAKKLKKIPVKHI